MDDIPALALQKILELVPFKDRRACREVCKYWKQEIELSPFVGLSIKIDNRMHGLLNFLKNVVVRELNICALILGNNQHVDLWKNLKLEDATTVALSGYASPQFIHGNLLQANNWPQLTKLYFGGTFLIGQELSQDGDLAQTALSCSFDNLKELHFLLSGSTIHDADNEIKKNPELNFLIPPHVAGLCPEIHVPRLLIMERAHRNTSYLLSVIQAPKLKVLHVLLGTSCFWDLEPLYKFIEIHGTRLDQLVVKAQEWFQFQFSPEPLPDLDRRFCPTKKPDNLRSIYLHNIDPNQKFWMYVIKLQEHLEELLINLTGFQNFDLNGFFNTLIMQNYESLKCLYIIGDAGTSEDQELDMEGLSLLPQLEVLVVLTHGHNRAPYPEEEMIGCMNFGSGALTFDHLLFPRNFRIKNINNLPHTLKVFTTSFQIGKDFNGVRFLQENLSLEELKLPCLTRTGFLKGRRQVSELVQAALRHRRLNIFSVGFTFPEDHVPDIGGEWENILPIHHTEFNSPVSCLSESDCILEILKGTCLIEKVHMGVETWNDWRDVYFRNLFEALQSSQLPGKSSEQPFYRNSQTSYVKIESRAQTEENRMKDRGLIPPRPLSESSSPDQFHTAFNFCLCNLNEQAIIEFLIDIEDTGNEPKGDAMQTSNEQVKRSELPNFFLSKTKKIRIWKNMKASKGSVSMEVLDNSEEMDLELVAEMKED